MEARKNASFDEMLSIPNNASVSNDRLCNVFQITYEVKIYMKAEKKSSAVVINIPICIGSIGFREGSAISLDSTSLPMDELRKNKFKFLFFSSIVLLRDFYSSPFHQES